MLRRTLLLLSHLPCEPHILFCSTFVLEMDQAFSAAKISSLTAPPTGTERMYVKNVHAVKKEDAKLLRMWVNVLGDADGA